MRKRWIDMTPSEHLVLMRIMNPWEMRYLTKEEELVDCYVFANIAFNGNFNCSKIQDKIVFFKLRFEKYNKINIHCQLLFKFCQIFNHNFIIIGTCLYKVFSN